MKEILRLYYDRIRNEVKSRHFTKAFYEGFINDYEDACRTVIENGKRVEEEMYLRSKASAFYEEDSSEYCHFLEVFTGCLKSFRIRWYEDGYEGAALKTTTAAFPDKESAQRYADAFGRWNEVTQIA